MQDGAYYHPAVAWGTHSSVLKGYDDGLFRPDKPITRVEVASVIRRFLEK